MDNSETLEGREEQIEVFPLSFFPFLERQAEVITLAKLTVKTTP